MKTSNIVLATGIVGGLVTVYAIKNNYSVEDMKSKALDLRGELNLIIEDLSELALEILERLYNIVNELVKMFIYKVEGLLHKVDLELA